MHNLQKVEMLKDLAITTGFSPTQLAISWVKEQGGHIILLVSMSNDRVWPKTWQRWKLSSARKNCNFTSGRSDTKILLIGMTSYNLQQDQLKDLLNSKGEIFVLVLNRLLKDWECANPKAYATSPTERSVVESICLASIISLSCICC